MFLLLKVGRNERINYAKGLLQREFLPHVGIGAGTEAKKVRGQRRTRAASNIDRSAACVTAGSTLVVVVVVVVVVVAVVAVVVCVVFTLKNHSDLCCSGYLSSNVRPIPAVC